jgi:hypothetical protein
MSGVGLREVQELMGHKTIQMTCRYAHLTPAFQLAAVEKLASFTDTVAQVKAPATESSTGAKTSTAVSAVFEEKEENELQLVAA